MPSVLERPPSLSVPSLPVIEPDPPDQPPQTLPKTMRQWWRFRFPWVKTAVSAPTQDDELLIDNETADAWNIHLGYRNLGVVEPQSTRTVQVVKTGMLTARPVDAPVGTAYLTVLVNSSVRVVEIRCSHVHGEPLYDLWLIEQGTSASS